MHQTKIHLMVISANNNATSTSTQISKGTKAVSCVSSIFLNCRSTPVSMNGHTAEFLWVPDVFLAVTIAGINLSCKRDITKRRSRPCLVTCRRYLVGRSVWTPVPLNVLQRCLIVWDVFSNCQAACSRPNSKIMLTSFLRTSWHGFLVLIKREKSILFDVSSHHYETANWMRWKLNFTFRSVHGIRLTYSFNVLKIATLNVK